MTGCLVTFFSHDGVAFGPDRMSSTSSSPLLNPLAPDYGLFHCPQPVFVFMKGEIVREDDGLLGHLFLT
jgi:hypothetical protein